MITDGYLQTLAARAPADGSFTPEEQAQLSMALPDIAAELLAKRGTSAATQSERAEGLAEQLHLSRMVIYGRERQLPETMREACRVFLTHGTHIEAQIAREILRTMESVAA